MAGNSAHPGRAVVSKAFSLYGLRSALVRSTRGRRLPLHGTGVGKVLLAPTSPAFVDALTARGLERCPPYTLTTGRELNRALTEVRRTGLAFQREEMDLGLISVAAPLTDAGSSVVAAPSVVVRSSRYQLRQLTAAVQTAVAGASREMRERGVRGANPDGMRLIVNDQDHQPLKGEQPVD